MSIPPNPYVIGNHGVPLNDEIGDQSNYHDNSIRDAANNHNNADSDESFRGHKFGHPYSTVSSHGVQVPPPSGDSSFGQGFGLNNPGQRLRSALGRQPLGSTVLHPSNNYSMLHNQNMKDRSEDPANSTNPPYDNQFVHNNQAYPSASTRVDVWQQTTTQEFWDDRLVYHQRIDRHEVHHRDDNENHGVNSHNTYRTHDTHNGVHDYDSPGYPRRMPTFNGNSDQPDSESNSRSVPPRPTASPPYEQYRSGSGEKPRFQAPPSQGMSDEVQPRAHTTPPHAPSYVSSPPANLRLPTQQQVPQPTPNPFRGPENPVDGIATRRQQQKPEADQPSSSKQARPKSTSDAQNAGIIDDIFRMAQAGKIDQYTADHLLEQLYPTGGDQTPERVRTPEIVQVKSYHQTPSPASGSIEKCRSSSTNTASTDNSNVDHNDVSGGLTNAGMISPNFSKGRKSNNPFYALSVAARAPATSAESSSVLDRSFPQDEKNSRDDGDFAWNPYSEGYRSVTPNLATPRPNEQLRSASVERREFAAPPRSDDGQARPRTPSRDALSYVEAPSPSSYLSPTIQNPALSGSPKRLRTSLQRLSSNQDPPPESPPPSSSQAHLQQQRMEADQAAKNEPDSREHAVDSIAALLMDLLVEDKETETDTVGNTSPAVKEMPSNADAQAIMGPLQDLLAKERDIRVIFDSLEELLKTRRDPIPRLPASELAYSQTPRSSHSTLPTPPPPPPQSQSQQQQQQMGVDQPSDSGQIWGRTVDSTDELLRCLLVSDEPDTVAVDNTLPTGYNVSPAAKENVRKRDVFKRFLPTSKKDRDPKW